MNNDELEYIKKCEKCKRHGDIHITFSVELSTLTAPWFFSRWGMDILGPQSLRPGHILNCCLD